MRDEGDSWCYIEGEWKWAVFVRGSCALDTVQDSTFRCRESTRLSLLQFRSPATHQQCWRVAPNVPAIVQGVEMRSQRETVADISLARFRDEVDGKTVSLTDAIQISV